MNRISKDEYFMRMACDVVPLRGTCERRQVGCVLVDSEDHILSTGYNGTPSGMSHCCEEMCGNAMKSKSGEGLDSCGAIHAEQNALLQCPDVGAIHKAYVSTSPCFTCMKLLLNTACKHIIFKEEYPHKECKRIWESTGRQWNQLKPISEITS